MLWKHLSFLLGLYISTTMIMKQMQKSLTRVKNTVNFSKMLSFILNKQTKKWQFYHKRNKLSK